MARWWGRQALIRSTSSRHQEVHRHCTTLWQSNLVHIPVHTRIKNRRNWPYSATAQDHDR